MQAKPPGGEVFPDDGHAQVCAVTATHLSRERVAVVACLVGPTPGLGQEGLPLAVGETVTVPVGTRVLTAVIEEPNVVVLFFEWLDFAIYELVQLDEIGGEILGNVMVHGPSSGCAHSDRSEMVPPRRGVGPQTPARPRKRRRRSELVTTNTDENAMVPAAIIGSSTPTAASGTAATL